jgi:hypothetical protein
MECITRVGENWTERKLVFSEVESYSDVGIYFDFFISSRTKRK